MITNNEEMEFVRKQLGHVENALVDLKIRLLPDNKKAFEIMASSYIRQISELQNEINEYIGFVSPCIDESAEFVIRLVGPEIGYGTAPISILTNILDEVRIGIQNICAYVQGYGYVRRPPKTVIENCDLSLVGVLAGSLQVALRRPYEKFIFFSEFQDDPFNKTANIYFTTAKWAAQRGSAEALMQYLPDENLRDIALKSVLRAIPKDSKKVSSLNFYGKLVNSNIYLNEGARSFIIDSIVNKNDSETIHSFEGRIREIDLDKNSFRLRDIRSEEPINEVICAMDEELLEDVKELLDEFAIVKGIMLEDGKNHKKIKVRYVERIEVE
jgi:hypothetical protein